MPLWRFGKHWSLNAGADSLRNALNGASTHGPGSAGSEGRGKLGVSAMDGGDTFAQVPRSPVTGDRLAASAFLREGAPGLLTARDKWAALVSGSVPHGLGGEGVDPGRKQRGSRSGTEREVFGSAALPPGERGGFWRRGGGAPTGTRLCPERARDVREAAGSASGVLCRSSASLFALRRFQMFALRGHGGPRALGLRQQKTRREAVCAKAARSRRVGGQCGVRRVRQARLLPSTPRERTEQHRSRAGSTATATSGVTEDRRGHEGPTGTNSPGCGARQDVCLHQDPVGLWEAACRPTVTLGWGPGPWGGGPDTEEQKPGRWQSPGLGADSPGFEDTGPEAPPPAL